MVLDGPEVVWIQVGQSVDFLGPTEVALYCHSDPLHVQALSLESRANLARGGNHYKSLMVHIEMIVYNKNPRTYAIQDE